MKGHFHIFAFANVLFAYFIDSDGKVTRDSSFIWVLNIFK